MEIFYRLWTGQIICYLITVMLAVTAIKEHGLSASVVPSLGVLAILAAIGWIGPQVVHELAEINDQLAGRSKELHDFFSKLNKKHN